MRIAIIGGGNMGMAFSDGMVAKGYCHKDDLLIIQTPGATYNKLLAQGYNVTDIPDEDLLSCRYIFISVKPQIFPLTTAFLQRYTSPDAVFISMMAGLTTGGIAQKINREKIVRIMPNTPSRIGQGITGAYFSGPITETEKTDLKHLLEATGPIVVFDDESLINTVTALSGSGPAYFFYFVKHMVQAGEELGMDREQAKDLVYMTMKGAFELLNKRDAEPDGLMQSVTSKKGTTEAALTSFDTNGMGDIIRNGVKAAESRARELSELLEAQ